jgi:UDP-N-acetylglucosamine/UDP-N-acetylgalactosamine diphosphorylase
VIGVDNIMNKVLDPIQVGFTALEELQCSLKACVKRDAGEKVGVIGKRNGNYDIVEYSELSSTDATALGPDGQLKFKLGHILVFMIKADFLVKLVSFDSGNQNSLYHKAFKKIVHADPETWEDIEPTSENGWKFELFMHSLLPKVEGGRLGVLTVDRDSEFGPVKNADDPSGAVAPDTPACARQMYLADSMHMLKQVTGLKVEAGAQIEVSPLLSYAGENLNWLKHVHKGKGLTGPRGFIDHQGEYTKTD